MSAFAASGVFFFILFVGLVVCLMPAVEWHFPSDEEEHEVVPEEKPRRRKHSRYPDAEERPKTPSGRREESSSSRSRQANLPPPLDHRIISSYGILQDIKVEPRENQESQVSAVPIASTPGTSATRDNPVRRRTPRLTEDLEG